jgi:hypothetical protein
MTPSLFCPHHKATPSIIPQRPATAATNISPPPPPTSASNLHKLGIYTSLPTPASTPEFVNLASLRHLESPCSDSTTSPACSTSDTPYTPFVSLHHQRPVNLRASTLPITIGHKTESITAVEATVLYAKREIRSGGPAEGVSVERFTSPKALGVSRSASTGSDSSKDRFVNGLVG